MTLTLVILAAGKGSRFGGDKPMAVVGPQGQALFEYSVFDAVNAGFNHIVFVVSAQQQTEDFAARLAVYGRQIKLDFVRQSAELCVEKEVLDSMPGVREKPWGTAHAVLVCQDVINNPFAVINADDYYGRTNFAIVADHLRDYSHDPSMCVLPGYRLNDTLSRAGGVNRGICAINASGYLESVQEAKHITLHEDGLTLVDENQTVLAGDSTVSMTFWGFHPAVFELFHNGFRQFLSHTQNILTDEFYIPTVVDSGIRGSQLYAKVLPTAEQWKGITFAEDVKEVRQFLALQTAKGFYPQRR
ncbi:MAG: NTP transferase domain-containing protein [Pseudomonadota bacterium]